MTNPLEKYLPFADEPTPKPMNGRWILIAPDGRDFNGDSPIECVQAEMATRVPPRVALGRIARSIEDNAP